MQSTLWHITSVAMSWSQADLTYLYLAMELCNVVWDVVEC